jgi:hypothetical protein
MTARRVPPTSLHLAVLVAAALARAVLPLAPILPFCSEHAVGCHARPCVLELGATLCYKSNRVQTRTPIRACKGASIPLTRANALHVAMAPNSILAALAKALNSIRACKGAQLPPIPFNNRPARKNHMCKVKITWKNMEEKMPRLSDSSLCARTGGARVGRCAWRDVTLTLRALSVRSSCLYASVRAPHAMSARLG